MDPPNDIKLSWNCSSRSERRTALVASSLADVSRLSSPRLLVVEDVLIVVGHVDVTTERELRLLVVGVRELTTDALIKAM